MHFDPGVCLHWSPSCCVSFWLVVPCSPDVSLCLSPFICLTRCLAVSGHRRLFTYFLVINHDVSLCLSPFSLVCLYLSPFSFSPGVPGGVRLSKCLFSAFTWLSPYVPRHASPNFSVSEFICDFTYRWAGASGSFAFSPLFIFHHLSFTIYPVLHISPNLFASNHMFALVAMSCSNFILAVFVFRARLCILCS